MIPDVYRMLIGRHEAQGKPADGWVFPSTARDGHLEQGTAKTQHSAAIAKVNAKTIKANAKRQVAGEKFLSLPLTTFEPYVMRHTALTRMAPFCDAFTLARIAGHSSITITQRYCHPQADAVEAAFSKFGNRSEVVTEAGHHEKHPPSSTDGKPPLSILRT
jgi:integrase